MLRWFIALIALLVAAIVYWQWPRHDAPRQDEPVGSVSRLLSGGEGAGYAQALAPRPFAFPADFGPHNDFRQEWWYYTGNLDTADGRHFGYQLTFFRFAIASATPARASHWATRQVYLAHFTVTDATAQTYHSEERLDRAAVGLAGAQAEPYKVWLEDWQATGDAPQGLPMHLKATGDDMAIDLDLKTLKPVVLQGDRGLSQKGSRPGNASYYYSLTRLASTGTLRIGGRSYTVSGLSWMDREWSTSALEPDQVGWDWFSLQLADGRELMYYRLRRKDGAPDPHSGGVIIDRDGGSERLTPDEINIAVTGHWQSPHSGAAYPSGWRITLPRPDLRLEVTPYVKDQELSGRLRYWEGAVRVEDDEHRPLGSGYIELVGYAQP